MRSLSRRTRLAVFSVITAVGLVSSVTYAVASQASPAGQAHVSAAAGQCRGVAQSVFKAKGFITDPARGQGGHMWSRALADGSTCVGTVVEFVRYNVPMTKTWRVVVYSAAHPRGQVAASATFTLNQGWYFFPFRVRRPFAGLTKVCLTADQAFGTSCVRF